MTDRKFFFTVFMILGFISLFYGLYKIFSPFITSLLWASMIVLVFYPVYRRVLQETKQRESLSAILMCFFLTLFVLLPTIILAMLVFQELAQGAQSLTTQASNISFQDLLNHPLIIKGTNFLKPYVDLESLNPKNQLIKTAEQTSQFVFGLSTGFFKLFSDFLITVALIELNMFFLFRDGGRFVRYLKSLLPLSEESKQTLGRRLNEVVQTSILGTFVTAGANGMLGGLIFAILGLPSATLWGVLMAILAFIPLIGPFIIWAPAAAYLMLTGHLVKGLILVAWGLIAMMGFADYMIRPILLSRISSDETRLNTLVLFLSVMGGIAIYGILGIVIGPLLVVLVLTLLEMYRMYYQPDPHFEMTGQNQGYSENKQEQEP